MCECQSDSSEGKQVKLNNFNFLLTKKIHYFTCLFQSYPKYVTVLAVQSTLIFY